MHAHVPGFPGCSSIPAGLLRGSLALLILASGLTLFAQSAANTTPAQSAPAPAAAYAEAQPSTTAEAGAITEDQLRQHLTGKTFYLRGGYLDNSLHFNENGQLTSNSPQASYTLSLVEINKVHLGKHKVELEGVRYGLHFLGGLPSTDPTQAADIVRLTPKKKTLKIAIEREVLVKPKKEKAAKTKGRHSEPATTIKGPANIAQAPSTSITEPTSDRRGVTTTTSPAHANRILKSALESIFSHGVDNRMIASMPDYWKLYYQAAAVKSDYRPTDAAVLRQSMVDRKAKLLQSFEAASNEFAQTNGVAGLALYHVVVSPEGKAAEIAVARPIGFGLDENAVASIRKATFQPALKDGKPVPVLLDLTIQFRIYSKRTAAIVNSESAKIEGDQQATPSLPGPYSANKP